MEDPPNEPNVASVAPTIVPSVHLPPDPDHRGRSSETLSPLLHSVHGRSQRGPDNEMEHPQGVRPAQRPRHEVLRLWRDGERRAERSCRGEHGGSQEDQRMV